jgi:hypothetical protein
MTLADKLERWAKRLDDNRHSPEGYNLDNIELCDLLREAVKQLRKQNGSS